MYKHTINFQIGDQFTVKDLKTIAKRKYAEQIDWYISMSKNHGYTGESLKDVIRDLTRCVNIDKDSDNICEIREVEEYYNYLRVYLRCIHPDIENYFKTASMRSSGKGIKGSDAIVKHEESWYRDREHWSEFHGWN